MYDILYPGGICHESNYVKIKKILNPFISPKVTLTIKRKKSTSVNVRKLGTLKELLIEHGPTRDADVMKWAKRRGTFGNYKI